MSYAGARSVADTQTDKLTNYSNSCACAPSVNNNICKYHWKIVWFCYKFPQLRPPSPSDQCGWLIFIYVLCQATVKIKFQAIMCITKPKTFLSSNAACGTSTQWILIDWSNTNLLGSAPFTTAVTKAIVKNHSQYPPSVFARLWHTATIL